MNMEINVLQAKRFGVLSCHPDTVMEEAARKMVSEDISALVVEDDLGYLEGIITRTDLLTALTRNEDWRAQPVKDYMSREVVTVSPQTQLQEIARLLLDRQIHRVVAVREEEGKMRPVAVISAADLVYHMVK